MKAGDEMILKWEWYLEVIVWACVVSYLVQSTCNYTGFTGGCDYKFAEVQVVYMLQVL